MSIELQPAAAPQSAEPPRATTSTGAQRRLADDGVPFETAFQCQLCGEVIGVYEPLVVCEDSHARTTSRTAEPGLRARDGAYHHRACFTRRDGLAG